MAAYEVSPWVPARLWDTLYCRLMMIRCLRHPSRWRRDLLGSCPMRQKLPAGKEEILLFWARECALRGKWTRYMYLTQLHTEFLMPKPTEFPCITAQRCHSSQKQTERKGCCCAVNEAGSRRPRREARTRLVPARGARVAFRKLRTDYSCFGRVQRSAF